MSKLFSASLLAFGIVFAMPSVAQQDFQVLGTIRDTTNGSDWQVKYLGGPNIGSSSSATPNETFDWAAQRTYTNGVLNTTGYSTAFRISNSRAKEIHWNTNIPWISRTSNAIDANGYYSFVTVINDDFSSLLAKGESITFNGLRIAYASDDHLHAIIVNGIKYDGFTPQATSYAGWVQNYADILLTDISWNINGSNTIEFIVHNNNSGDFPYSSYGNVSNASGLSATIQAAYYLTPVPEPEIYVMLLAGLGLIGAVARRRKSQ